MIYSTSAQMWCVHPTRHTNYIDVIDWCNERWGPHKIDNTVHGGIWSYCEGTYYGLTRMLSGHVVDDNRLYFSFIRQEDALFFSLKWA